MKFRAGFVAIVGEPNVGKSTLLNALLNFKLSIVSPKPQTTRHKILGILTGENYQAVFLDTPGIISPRYTLQEFMQREVSSAIDDADVIVLMVEPEERINRKVVDRFLERFKRVPVLLTINKIDKVKEKERLLPLIDEYSKYGFKEVYPISALYRNGLEDLREGIVKSLPEGEPFYPPDQLTDKPERFFVAELIREQIFTCYGEEIPYSTSVEVEEFVERPQKKDYIRAVIYVEKPSQKPIIIGRRGEALKRVGERARKEIETFLGRKVYLELWVKVYKGWRREKGFIRERIYSGQKS